MPLSRGLARFNRVATNRLVSPLAVRLPGFCLLVHRGRRSGRTYRTPVNCFLSADRIYVALTYGPGVDWLANLRAGGGGEVVMRGRRHRLGAPEVVGEEGMGVVPAPLRIALGAIGVHWLAVLPLLSGGRTS